MTSFRDDLLERVRRLVKRKVFADRKVVLFGASLVSGIVLDELARSGVRVDAIVDNNSEKVGRSMAGHVIESVEGVLVPHDPRAAVVVISASYRHEMEHRLRQLGYRSGQIHHVTAGMRDTTWEFFRALVGAARGTWTYHRLVGRTRPRRVLFIAPYEGTGDIYVVGLFFQEYLRRNEITDYTFAVVSGACGRVAAACGIENVVVRTPTQLNGVIHWFTFTHRSSADVVVLNDGWLAEAAQWLRGYKGLNFERMFRYFVFGFDDAVPLELPPVAAGAADGPALLRDLGLPPGRTVVLAPHANTLYNTPDMSFWSGIADSLAGKGFTVVTNCVGSEQPVPGTNVVSFAFKDAVAFMDAAGYFVGVRSGLCDIISSSSCRMVILYDGDGRFYKSSFLEYFSLRDMGLNADAIELEYRAGDEHDVTEAILMALA